MYDVYVYVCSTMPTFFAGTSPLITSAPPKAYVGDNGSMLCTVVIPISICFKAFQYIRLRQRNTGFLFVALTFATPRNASEMKCFIAKNVWIFHIPSCIHFTKRKNC